MSFSFELSEGVGSNAAPFSPFRVLPYSESNA